MFQEHLGKCRFVKINGENPGFAGMYKCSIVCLIFFPLYCFYREVDLDSEGSQKFYED